MGIVQITLDLSKNSVRLKSPITREAEMSRPVDERTLKAERLLTTPHPRSPSGLPYTRAEAAREAGIALATLYYHLNKNKQEVK